MMPAVVDLGVQGLSALTLGADATNRRMCGLYRLEECSH